MQASSTQNQSTVPPEARTRSWRKVFDDISSAARQRQLWAHLGWQDIKQRYRRSVLGPLWITISMGVTAAGLGLMYSTIFGQDPSDYVPYMTVGFIIWYFISGCLTAGTEVFIQNEGMIKQLPAPISIYVFRTVWREFLLSLHNLVIYLAILAIFTPPVGLDVLAAVPALLLLLVNGGWVVLLFGITSTRFRDIPPVVTSFMQLVFFMSPIVWPIEALRENAGPRAWLAQLNPVYHYVDIVRAPLLGEPQDLHHWLIVLAITVVGWALALLMMRNYRARVSYWV
ncbi:MULTISPECIES: ABC transporter permease [Actinopolyspora]|uniref:ABC-2 type transport system permease protein n=1 Tax=Actinopolyspora saharensis TaxID=995062 RepID=A0A1H1FEW3_9ACTN|nr:ABC transporter permease [Actinopolyspora saharensis]NHD19270.1 ABC transporter permease [Actinopolyspora sp. BKK2]NHE78394.1 ABC transporter permease [Actinopolyspora sp. BKK1]SDQ99532.1 ABC-2 type transport system permease protein [Actinopolyspora saharensis]